MVDGEGTPEDTIDLTKDEDDDKDTNQDDKAKLDKGKQKAVVKEDNEVQDDAGLLQYFNHLLE
jgi:hypothetical protein